MVITLPAEAATLQSWRFDASRNQLTFTTEGGVQPRAQLIADPTRLVIDLPGTTLGRPGTSQVVGEAIREVRVGQFDAQTTRIVIELNSGYTLNPQGVQVRGATPSQWTVQLPTPERVEPSATVVTPPIANTPSPNLPPTESVADTPAVSGATTQLESVRVTPDGFFLRTTGDAPAINVDRSRNRRQITIDLAGTAISPQLTQRQLDVNRNGVGRLEITQAETSPPVARLTLDLTNPGIEWRATASNFGGIVVVPTSGAIARTEDDSNDDEPEIEATAAEPATIEAIELANGNTQLLIRANQPLTYTSGWDRATAAYQITIPSARLDDSVEGPQLDSGSPLMRVRLRQESEDTVVVLVQPATGVQIGSLNQPSGSLLALELQRSAAIAVPSPTSTAVPPSTAQAPVSLPGVSNSRVVVVIDPGHGGPDPGAVGINGLRETEIVLPIGIQVASLLQQQGIQAILTRQDERDLDLAPRVQIAERSNADLFVSIHANAISLSRPDVNGIETYYYSSGGLPLAQTIHRSILQGTGMTDRGVRQARFYVIRNTSMPAVLLEVGFVTGRDDAARLSDPAFRNQMAAAIARGILQYVQQNL
nr:N-acetylmuramoyl-L-alanine amidase [Oculatella sp. LEGE 06141]